MNRNKWLYVHTLPHWVRRSSPVWCIVLPFSLFLMCHACQQLLVTHPKLCRISITQSQKSCLYFSLLWIFISFFVLWNSSLYDPPLFPALFLLFFQHCSLFYPIMISSISTVQFLTQPGSWIQPPFSDDLKKFKTSLYLVCILHTYYTHIQYVYPVQLGEFSWSVSVTEDVNLTGWTGRRGQ